MSLNNIKIVDINTENISSSDFGSNSEVDVISSNIDSFASYANSTFSTGPSFEAGQLLNSPILYTDSSNANSAYATSNIVSLSTAVNSGDNLLVYLDGLLQHPDTYVLSGDSIQFANVDPLPSNVSVGIRYLATPSILIANTAIANTTISANGSLLWDYESKRLYVYDGITVGGFYANAISSTPPDIVRGFSDIASAKSVSSITTLYSSFTATNLSPDIVFSTNKQLWISDWTSATPTYIRVYDISNDPINPSYLGNANYSGVLTGQAVADGNHVYLSTGGNTLRCIKWDTSTNSVVELDSITGTGIGNQVSLWIRDDGSKYLLCTNAGNWCVIDISDPTNMTYVGFVFVNSNHRAWAATNSWLLVFEQNGFVTSKKIGNLIDGGTVSSATSSTNSSWRGLRSFPGAIITVGENKYFVWDYFNGIYAGQLFSDDNATGPVGSAFASTPVATGTGSFSYPTLMKDDYNNIYTLHVSGSLPYLAGYSFNGTVWTLEFGGSSDINYRFHAGTGTTQLLGENLVIHEEILYLIKWDSDADTITLNRID